MQIAVERQYNFISKCIVFVVRLGCMNIIWAICFVRLSKLLNLSELGFLTLKIRLIIGVASWGLNKRRNVLSTV